jgi:hypothetical protein
MSESFPRSTVAVFAGGPCVTGVDCSALDMAMMPPVAAAAAAARTTAAAITKVFRLTA